VRPGDAKSGFAGKRVRKNTLGSRKRGANYSGQSGVTAAAVQRMRIPACLPENLA